MYASGNLRLMLTCPLVGTFMAAVESWVINILPAAFFSIAEGGVILGVAKISATVETLLQHQFYVLISSA